MRLRTIGLIVILALSLLAAPLAAEAQQPGKVHRIGLLGQTSPSVSSHLMVAFRQGLSDLGWVEGRNIVLVERWAEGKAERLPDLAAELARAGVDVILVGNAATARAAKEATTTIPIVMAGVPNPVGAGLVASLARPGANVTGLSFDVTPEISGKHLQLLKEAVPKVSRVALLSNPIIPGMALYKKEAHAAAGSLGIELQEFEVQRFDDLETTFTAIAKAGANGLVALPNPLAFLHRRTIADMAVRSRLPTIYAFREFVEDGALMSYGPSFRDTFARAALYVDRILKGAKASDLPVEQPTRFALVVNLKTAKALGLTIPPSVLVRADEVIQ
jgi:putative ABC transport system substrate-binding protein